MPAVNSEPPLSCLSPGGAAPLHFNDVPGENLDLDFLTSTVFTGSNGVRVMQGANGNFMGTRALTRFELTKLVLASSCINYTAAATANQTFSDVPQDDSEMSVIIGHAYLRNIIQGIAGHFYPQQHVTYGELFKILFGAARQQGYVLPPVVLSAPVLGITDESFRPYIEQAVSMHLLDLGIDQQFPQNQAVSRDAVVHILARYFRALALLNSN